MPLQRAVACWVASTATQRPAHAALPPRALLRPARSASAAAGSRATSRRRRTRCCRYGGRGARLPRHVDVCVPPVLQVELRFNAAWQGVCVQPRSMLGRVRRRVCKRTHGVGCMLPWQPHPPPPSAGSANPVTSMSCCCHTCCSWQGCSNMVMAMSLNQQREVLDFIAW